MIRSAVSCLIWAILIGAALVLVAWKSALFGINKLCDWALEGKA